MLKKMTEVCCFALVAVGLSGCDNPDVEAKKEQVMDAVEKARAAIEDHLDDLEDKEDYYADLAATYGEKAEALTKEWKEAMDYCEGKNTEKCDKLRESYESFKEKVAERAEQVQKAAEDYLDDKNE